MAFNRIIHRSFWLFICSYLSTNRWGLCVWNSPWWYSLFSNSTRKQQKQQLASFTQYTVLCAKTLIMACAYVGFFPVIFFPLWLRRHRQGPFYIRLLYSILFSFICCWGDSWTGLVLSEVQGWNQLIRIGSADWLWKFLLQLLFLDVLHWKKYLVHLLHKEQNRAQRTWYTMLYVVLYW